MPLLSPVTAFAQILRAKLFFIVISRFPYHENTVFSSLEWRYFRALPEGTSSQSYQIPARTRGLKAQYMFIPDLFTLFLSNSY
ncbi:hypothetical protein GZ78_12590 [Endozoicomonas numazuensis]|uniref:Uncharacterized protein n=1 Tax=Endozoicomonas numazuensis TaxID=1137799 RepID=A0A081NIR9_9GAMM|nr:hypothetical protein GZ78_12590 [Endozoicomonas numazuensis]